MSMSLNNNQSQRVMYSTFTPYKLNVYHTNLNKKRKKNIENRPNLLQPLNYSRPIQNTITNLSPINGYRQNTSNIINNPSNNYNINTNKSNSGIYNSYTTNPIYKSTIQPNIYSTVSILPTKYYTDKAPASQVSNIQTVPNITTTTNQIGKSEYYAPSIGIPSYSTQQVTNSYSIPQVSNSYSTPQVSNSYSTQQVTNSYSIPQVSNSYSTLQVSNSYSIPQVSDSYSIPQVSDSYSTQQVSYSYSTPQVSYSYSTPQVTNSYSTQQVTNSYSTPQVSYSYSTPQVSYEVQQNYTDSNNNIEYEPETINNQLINELVDNSNISQINNYPNIDANIDTNTINDEITSEYNIINQEEDKNIYQEPIVTKNDYLINSPKIINEPTNTDSPIFNSYIPKSPEISYRKNYLFPLNQSPLANYETRSYNGDNNIDIEEMLKLKEENEGYKQKIQELEYKYQAEKEEARGLKIQVEQLSPLKDKISEIDSLKAQLLELNELKNRINQLEILKNNIEEKDINEQKEEEKQLLIKNQETIKETETENKSIKEEIEERDNNKQYELDKVLENNKYEIELNVENEQDYVKGEIIHSIEELSMIIAKINNNNSKITLNLLYKATADSDKAKIFHKKCDNAQRTVVLIETDKGKRFGGYTSVNWKGKGLNKKDKNSFIFSLDNMKVYENIIGEKAIGCYPKFGPIFLGCQIRIYDQAFKNGGTTSKKGLHFDTDEDYVLTGGEKKFKIKEIEVYEVIAQ